MNIRQFIIGVAIATTSSIACTSNVSEPSEPFDETKSALTTPLSSYFHLTGSTLTIDGTAPSGSTAATKDSAGVSFAGGNPWVDVGTWSATPAFTNGILTSFGDIRLWLGLKNSDDVGTRFDVGAEVYKNGTLLAGGTTYCVQNLVRNAAQAKAVTVAVPGLTPTAFNGTADVLSVRIFTRIGTNPETGAACGGHSNATGLRSYFDSATRQAGFDTSLTTGCTGDNPDADCPKITCTTRSFRLVNNLWVLVSTNVETDVQVSRATPSRVELWSSGLSRAQSQVISVGINPTHFDASPPTPNDYLGSIQFSTFGGAVRGTNVGGIFQLNPIHATTRPLLTFMYDVTCSGMTSIRTTPPPQP